MFDTGSLGVTFALGEICDKDGSDLLLHSKQVSVQYSMKSSDSESTRVNATRHSFSPKSREPLEFCYKPQCRAGGLKTYKRLHTWVPIGRLKIPVGRGLSNPSHP